MKKIVQCLENGVIPVSSIKRGDVLISHSGIYELRFEKSGDINICSQKHKRLLHSFRRISFEGMPEEIMFNEQHGRILLRLLISDKKENLYDTVSLVSASADLIETTPNNKLTASFNDNGFLEFVYSNNPKVNLDRWFKSLRFNKPFICIDEVIKFEYAEILASKSGKYILAPQDDRAGINLTSLLRRKSLWRFEAQLSRISELRLTKRGLVLFTNEKEVLITAINNAEFIELADNGRLIARGPAWEQIQIITPDRSGLIRKVSELQSDDEYQKSILKYDDRLVSPNGLYKFFLASNGCFEIRSTTDNRLISNTKRLVSTSPDGSVLQLIKAGRLWIYNSSGSEIIGRLFDKDVFENGTQSHQLSLTNSGKLNLTRLIDGKSHLLPFHFTSDKLSCGEFLEKGRAIFSNNSRFKFELQLNGNIAITDLVLGRFIYQTKTTSNEDGKLIFQDDGNLVYYNSKNDVIWSSNTYGKGLKQVVLSDDGVLNFLDEKGIQQPQYQIPANHFAEGEAVHVGKSIVSTDGSRYHLIIDDNDSLSILDSHKNELIYTSYGIIKYDVCIVHRDNKLQFYDKGAQRSYRKITLDSNGICKIYFDDDLRSFVKLTSSRWYGDFDAGPGILLKSRNSQYQLRINRANFEVIRRFDDHKIFSSNLEFPTSAPGVLSVENKEPIFTVDRVPRWRTCTRDFSYMELTDHGVLQIVHNDNMVWRPRKIVCLAWGSLVWDPRNLRMLGGWHMDGPEVSVEYSRKSNDGRLTLVLTNSSETSPSLYTYLDVDNLDKAAENLGDREGIPIKLRKEYIGRWSQGDEDPIFIPGLKQWATRMQVEHVVWTNLPPKLKYTNLDGGKIETPNPSSDELIAYVIDLKKRYTPLPKGTDVFSSALFLAERYVRLTPQQIRTPLRKFFEQPGIGWTYDESLLQPPEEGSI